MQKVLRGNRDFATKAILRKAVQCARRIAPRVRPPLPQQGDFVAFVLH